MPDKKAKNGKGSKKPSVDNDQLGENAGMPREAKTDTRSGKCR